MQAINEVPVFNATKSAKITITPLDVKRGDKKDAGKCAAARACVHDMSAVAARVHVGRTYVELPAKQARRYGVKAPNGSPVWVRFRTPNSLRTEIVAFDRAKSFDPGDYILPPCQPSHRATGRRYGGNGADAKQVSTARRTMASKAKGGGTRYKRPAARHVLGGVRKFDPKELKQLVA